MTTENITLHAHVAISSADCDGGHGYDYVAFFSDDENAERETANGINDFSDIHFMERVMMSVASPYAVSYKMTIEVGEWGFNSHEQTDEGYRAAEVRWCRDDCEDESSVYDQYAEDMGY